MFSASSDAHEALEQSSGMHAFIHSPVFVVAVSLRFLQTIINSSIVHSRRPDCCVCVVAILTQSTLTDSDWLVFFLVYSFPEFTAFDKNKRKN